MTCRNGGVGVSVDVDANVESDAELEFDADDDVELESEVDVDDDTLQPSLPLSLLATTRENGGDADDAVAPLRLQCVSANAAVTAASAASLRD
jgi:hypothetical protein